MKALPVLIALLLPLTAKEFVATKGIVFCWCPPSGDQDGFWMAKHEITVAHAKGKAALKLPDGTILEPDHPMVMADLKTIRRFLKALNDEGRKNKTLPEGWQYDLPSEHEWEFACRAGDQREFSPAILSGQANFADKTLRESRVSGDFFYADVTHTDGFSFLAPVGSLKANAWGLHDMLGNVWEMTWRDEKKKEIIFCGGSWCTPASACQPASRRRAYDREKSRFSGFRIVMRKQ